MSTLTATNTGSSALSSDELNRATQFLVSTREALLSAVDGLSEEQWHFRPAPDCWSIADIVEHLAIIEERVPVILGRLPCGEPAEPGRPNAEIDAGVLTLVPDRSNKFHAPDPVCPKGQCSAAESLARYLAARSRTIQLLPAAPAMRGYVLPHPVAGTWDGYQWILGVAAHTARHTTQIAEVKQSAGYPGAN